MSWRQLNLSLCYVIYFWLVFSEGINWKHWSEMGYVSENEFLIYAKPSSSAPVQQNVKVVSGVGKI